VRYAALPVIAARPGLDQAALAGAIAFDRPTTGGVIDRLEAKGLVRRQMGLSFQRGRWRPRGQDFACGCPSP
jgi:DNA-binding MarR family transcriptional regulator